MGQVMHVEARRCAGCKPPLRFPCVKSTAFIGWIIPPFSSSLEPSLSSCVCRSAGVSAVHDSRSLEANTSSRSSTFAKSLGYTRLRTDVMGTRVVPYTARHTRGVKKQTLIQA